MLFLENLYYGHAEILLNHCGLPATLPIPHRIQHGWQPGPGLVKMHMAEPGPKIVWSSRNVASSIEMGFKGATPIGAPFLYLPEGQSAAPAEDKSLLAIPFHGWEKGGLHGSIVHYADELSELQAKGFGPITVCMYYFEYEQEPLRTIFESRGFKTTTMGRRGENLEFLHRQRDLIASHSVVTSNRVSTATFYALSLGVPFFLWGPIQGLEGSADPTGQIFKAWQREAFPELHFDQFDGRCHQDLGLKELGAEHMLDPEALRETLHLGPSHRFRRMGLHTRRYFHAGIRSLVPRRKD